MSYTKTVLFGAALLALAARPGLAVAASMPAVSFSNPSSFGVAGPVSAGFSFSVASDIQVTDLGAFDPGGDAFLNSHEVGIYDGNTIQLLASATVTSANDLVDGFRYAPITPITLDTSTFYIVAAADYNGAGEDGLAAVMPAALTVAPEIQYIQSAISQTHAGLSYPSLTFNPDITPFGGNFRYTAVPEPGTGSLFAAGGLALAALRRRRRSRGGRGGDR